VGIDEVAGADPPRAREGIADEDGAARDRRSVADGITGAWSGENKSRLVREVFNEGIVKGAV